MERASQIDHSETNISPGWEYFQMPALPNFENVQQAKAEYREKISSIPGKIAYLNSIPQERLDPELRTMIAELNRFYPYYESRLQDYAESATTEQEVLSRFGRALTIPPGSREKSVNDYVAAVNQEFEKSTNSIIAISETHMSTYFAVESAVENRAKKEMPNIAVFCFDNHPDVFEEDAAGFDPAKKEEISRDINEGNVFTALTGNGYIGGAVFIGPENKMVVDNANKLMRKASGHKDDTYFYVLGASEFAAADGNGVDRETLSAKLKEMVRVAKDDNVTNIVLSIDIDVLNAKRTGYTGFHYNPIELFNMLACFKLPEKSPTDLSEEDANNLSVSLFFAVDNLDEAVSEMQREGMDKEAIINDLEKRSIANPIVSNIEQDSYDPRGLNLGDVGVGLDAIISEARNCGIEIGVELSGGGRYVGDVIGLEGVDYKGFTARAAKSLADRMAKSVGSVS